MAAGSRFMHERLKRRRADHQVPRTTSRSAASAPVLVAGGIGVTRWSAWPRGEGRNRRCACTTPAQRAMALLRAAGPLADDLGSPMSRPVRHWMWSAARRLRCGQLPCAAPGHARAVLAATSAAGRTTMYTSSSSHARGGAGDHPFEVELAQSASASPCSRPDHPRLPDRARLRPVFDCKRGKCGVCATPVMSGEIDHRDRAAARERPSNVIRSASRAKGAPGALDL